MIKDSKLSAGCLEKNNLTFFQQNKAVRSPRKNEKY